MTQLPILILPGTLCTEAMFNHQIEQLQKVCANVSVVQFTTEKTLVEMVEKVIAAANNKPCAIIGFSMGGIVASQLAKTHPELIAKLALINSNCHADLPERKKARAEQIAQVKSGQLLALMTHSFIPNYLFNTNKAHEKLIIDMALSLGPACFAAQVKAIENRSDSLAILKKLPCDVLIIGGNQDSICPASHQKMMHSELPQSKLALLDQCGHFAPLEQEEKVSTLLTLWYLATD